MLLTEMRTKFKEQTGNFANALNDSAIDAYLNRAYRYGITDQVDGQFTSGYWEFKTATGQQVYPWPTYVHNVRLGAQIIPQGLSSTQEFSDESFRESEFWIDHDRAFTTESTPYAILHHNDSSTLYPIPNVNDRIFVPAKIRPTSGEADLKELDTLGLGVDQTSEIPYFTHANAVVKLAALEFTDDSHLPHIGLRIVGLSGTGDPLSLASSLMKLNSRSLAVPKGRRRRRTF